MKKSIPFPVSAGIALLGVAILLGLADGVAARGQTTVQRPSMPPRRTMPAGAAAQPAQQRRAAVTQPDGSGSSPVIPYDNSPNALNFQEASVDLVIMEYALRTKRTVIKSPQTPSVNITLRTTPDSPLDDDQYLMAIEQVLNMNGIALEPDGDKFLKVVPSSELRKHGAPIIKPDPETGEMPVIESKGQFISQMVELKYIDIAEAQAVITGFVRAGAQIQAIERTNSILITDSADTVGKIVEVLKYIDKPIIAREEPNIIQIKYAKAGDVKARLEEIVQSAQEESAGKGSTIPQERLTGAPGTVQRRLPPGVTLPSRGPMVDPAAPASAGAETYESLLADAQRGIIRGKVSIIADERTNVLIILTRPENMVFFNKLIEVLDIPTAPEVVVATYRLEHAVAEDVAAILNELIGKRKPSEDDANRSASTAGASRPPAETQPAAPELPGGATRTKVGQLNSENITVLADERTNALVIMSSYDDMATIREIIKQMDIMLSQVVIETSIISLTFIDTIETGVSWVQRAMMTGNSQDGSGPAMIFATAGGGSLSPRNPLTLTTTESLAGTGAGATFLATLVDFNMDVILKAIKSDTRATVMNSPIITTLDNKEAIIESTKRVYYSDGVTYYSGSDNTTENIKNEDVGIKLKVTPRINKSGYIVLTIEQEWQELNGYQELGSRKLPIIDTRKMGSDVAIQSGQTVVLGGLAAKGKTQVNSKVPLLGDIPLLGWFFRSSRLEDSRNEIVIFLTPRVIDTPAQIEDEARSRKASLDTAGIWDSGWSNSRLADPISEKEEAKIQERGHNTVMPPSYPLSRHLTPLNEEFGHEIPAEPTRTPTSSNDYVHFADVDDFDNPDEQPAEEARPDEAGPVQPEAPADGAAPPPPSADPAPESTDTPTATEPVAASPAPAAVEPAPVDDPATDEITAAIKAALDGNSPVENAPAN